MKSFRLTYPARFDIREILVRSELDHGVAASRRYERLIATALHDIAAEPERNGSMARPELGAGVRTWHLRGSRERARQWDGVVRRPRHFLIYKAIDPQIVAVGRVLHDAMELRRHLAALEDPFADLPTYHGE